jgi:hypothetical protein
VLEERISRSIGVVKRVGAKAQLSTTERGCTKTVATAKDVNFTVEAAKREIQSDLNAVTAHVIRQVQSNTKRISALEEPTGTENPNKH